MQICSIRIKADQGQNCSGYKDSGVQICMLRELSLTLGQGAMMNVAKIANVETKKKQWVAPILIKTVSSKRVMKCQIDSGASAPRWESQTL